MICKACAYKNLPIAHECKHCGKLLQSTEAVLLARERWENMPPEARKEIEDTCRVQQERFKQHIIYSIKNRWKRALISGGILGVLGFLHGPIIFPDMIIGFVVGWILNTVKGGGYRGMFLFGGAYMFSFLFKWVLGISYGNPFMGEVSAYYLPVLTMGQLLSLGAGLAYGMKIHRDYVDRA